MVVVVKEEEKEEEEGYGIYESTTKILTNKRIKILFFGYVHVCVCVCVLSYEMCFLHKPQSSLKKNLGRHFNELAIITSC